MRKLSGMMNFGFGPDDAILHVDRKSFFNRIEGNHEALERPLKPRRGLRRSTAAENTLKRIETHRAIKKCQLGNNEFGVLNEARFVSDLFSSAA